MTMLSEKVVVTAREFLNDLNINECKDLSEPMYQAKLSEFDWDIQFTAASTFCEVVWKKAITRDSLSEWRQLDKLFSPSPIATHANFRGCRSFTTGNIPEVGSIAIWKKGNTWQGHMAIVTEVAEDKKEFDIVEGRAFKGSKNTIIQPQEGKGKKVGLPFREDKLNLIGFIYIHDREIR